MGLENNSKKYVYLNISNGKIIYKDGNGNRASADSVSGIIKSVEYVDEEYEGKPYNKAKIMIEDGSDICFVLQMRTDSSYFRAFCNSLRSGNPKDSVKIVPSLKEIDSKKQRTCFVQQNGVWLKHFFTKDRNGDLPPLEVVSFKGQDHYDGTAQVEYWKKWLESNYELPRQAEKETDSTSVVSDGAYDSAVFSSAAPNIIADNDDDDLPF